MTSSQIRDENRHVGTYMSVKNDPLVMEFGTPNHLVTMIKMI